MLSLTNGFTNKKCFSSSPSSSSIILLTTVFGTFGINGTRPSMSLKLVNGAFSLSPKTESMCFFPSPGSNSSWCLLIVIDLELLKNSTKRASLIETKCSIVLSISATALEVRSLNEILLLINSISFLSPFPM